MKHLLSLLAALSLCCITTTADATAVGPEGYCDLSIMTTGAHPCIEFVQASNNLCSIDMVNRCDNMTVSIKIQNNLIGNSLETYELQPSKSRYIAVLYQDTQQAGHEELLIWHDETTDPPLSGKVSVRVSSFETRGSLDESTCAASPPQTPAAPLSALLPLLLGALAWRRRRNN